MSGKGSGRRPTDKTHALTCEQAGHTMPDARGRCFRCGEPVTPPETTTGDREIL